MKRLVINVFAVILSMCCFCFVGCDKSDKSKIDNSVYLNESVAYKVYGTSQEYSKKLSAINQQTDVQYTKILMSGNKKWIAGLNINKIKLTFVSNKPTIVDGSFTITNLKNGPVDNDNTKGDTIKYFELDFNTSLTITYEFVIDDCVKDDNNSNFVIDINPSCYIKDATLNISFTNISIYGNH